VLKKVQQRLDQDPNKMTLRRQTAEHPFGTIKDWMGATHFLMRGRHKVCARLQHETRNNDSGLQTTAAGDSVIGIALQQNRPPFLPSIVQASFGLAASLANRSALSRSRFLRSAFCSSSYSVRGLSDGRNMLLASFSRLPMT
jgi:hypothetical protein